MVVAPRSTKANCLAFVGKFRGDLPASCAQGDMPTRLNFPGSFELISHISVNIQQGELAIAHSSA